MCGIVVDFLSAIKNTENMDILVNGLKQLQNRGYDSAGICFPERSADKFQIVKKAKVEQIDSIEYLDAHFKK